MTDRVDICMIVDNDVQRDPRVRKEAASLAAHGYRVVVIGISRSGVEPLQSENISGFQIYRVISRLGRHTIKGKAGSLIRTLEGFVKAAWQLRRMNARAYHAHDFQGLLIVALAGIWRRPVVYDTHELFFERQLPAITRRLTWILKPLERLLSRHARYVITVSDGCGEYLVRTYGIAEPVILRNAAELRHSTLNAIPVDSPGQHLVAHSGWLSEGRHLEQLVDALSCLPESVGLLLVGGGQLEEVLKNRAQSAGLSSRLLTLGVIESDQIVPTLRQATIAAVLIEGRFESYHYALPNKFFEAVAAGLPLVVSPIPEVKRLVEDYGIGTICDPSDPCAIADAIKTTLEADTLARMRKNMQQAQADLNWETEARKLIALYDNMLGASAA